jgi:hypothetical protein
MCAALCSRRVQGPAGGPWRVMGTAGGHMADGMGAGLAVRGTAGCRVWRLVLCVEGMLDLAVGDLFLAIDAVGVGGEQDGDAVPGAGGDLGGRGAGVEPQGQGGVPQVVRPPGEPGGGRGGAEGAGAGLLPGPAVGALAEQPAPAAGNSRPSSAVPQRSWWRRSRVTRVGGMGTTRTACSGRSLRPRCSWLVPLPVQAAAVRGAVLARVSFPQPAAGRWQSAWRRAMASSGRSAA